MVHDPHLSKVKIKAYRYRSVLFICLRLYKLRLNPDDVMENRYEG